MRTWLLLVEVLTRDQLPVNRMIGGRDEVIWANRLAQQFRDEAVGPLVLLGDIGRSLLALVPAGESTRDDADEMGIVERLRLLERGRNDSYQALPSLIVTIHKKRP